MEHRAPRGWVAAGLLLVVVLGVFVVGVTVSQRQSRDDLRARFDERAQLSAALIGSVLGSGQKANGRRYARQFGGSHVTRAQLDTWLGRTNGSAAALLDGRGEVIAASSDAPGTMLANLRERPPYIRRALAGTPYALSDVLEPQSSRPVVLYAQPFRIRRGTRVLVSSVRPQLMYAFFADYLEQVPNRGGFSYLIDANGIVVGSQAPGVRPGRLLGAHGLRAALADAVRGQVHGSYFTSSGVAGSGWRVVLTSPDHVLFASVSGTRMWLPWLIVAAFVLAGVAALLAVLRVIRRGEDLRRSQERYELVVHGANDGIWDHDVVADELYVSPRWCEITGLPEDQPLTTDQWLARVHPDDRSALDAAIEEVASGRSRTMSVEYRLQHADGDWRWVHVRGAVAEDPRRGGLTRLAGSMSDVTDRKLAEQRLREDALHDTLTGLANRALFLDRLGLALDRTRRDPERRCAVMFCDLDRFKLINDSFSHAVGDELLVELGRRLTDVLRPGDTVARPVFEDTVARLGGDEFTILLEDVQDAAAPEAVAERILASLDEPFEVGGRSISVSMSIGIAFSELGTTPAEMMRNADLAMYRAKRRGLPCAELYTADMHADVTERLDLEIALRAAIEAGTMRVVYQPIVDLATGAIAGFEALSRWPDEERAVGPDAFIPVAEETGLIHRLGGDLLEAACAQLQAWRRAGLASAEMTMSVNVAGCQFDDPARLVASVVAALHESGLPPDALRLEITESTVIREPERLWTTLEELGRLGVRAHIDDFGTGYSSLQFLKHFPGDTLKVDRSFVASMVDDEAHHEIVRATIALAHDLGLGVIAEGIDDPAQLALLRTLGCELGQGYLLARPVPGAQLAELLRTWSPAQVLALAPAL